MRCRHPQSSLNAPRGSIPAQEKSAPAGRRVCGLRRGGRRSFCFVRERALPEPPPPPAAPPAAFSGGGGFRAAAQRRCPYNGGEPRRQRGLSAIGPAPLTGARPMRMPWAGVRPEVRGLRRGARPKARAKKQGAASVLPVFLFLSPLSGCERPRHPGGAARTKAAPPAARRGAKTLLCAAPVCRVGRAEAKSLFG